MKTTIYFSREEGWIHVIQYIGDDWTKPQTEVSSFSESLLTYWMNQADVYVFEAQRKS